MRVIRLKLKSDVRAFLEGFCQRYKISDRNFVEDVFSIVRLKGNGLPDVARAERLANFFSQAKKTSLVITKAHVNKRIQVLRQMIKTGVFQNFVSGKSSLNDMEFTESLLSGFVKLHSKLRQSQCMTCMFMNDCAFGKQYGAKVRDITVVQDPDYTKKVHPSCPQAPQIDLVNQLGSATGFANGLAEDEDKQASMMAATESAQGGLPLEDGSQVPIDKQEMQQMLEAEEAAIKAQIQADSDLESLDDESEDFMSSVGTNSAGKTIKHYDARHRGGQSVVLDEAMINRLKVSQLMIYELSMKLESLLAKHKQGTFRNTDKLTKERKQDTIKSVSDVSKLVPNQHAQDEDVFNVKLVKKQLIKKQQTEPQSKRQLLYLLIDVSGSMRISAGLSNAMGFITRASLAASFSIALSRRVLDDGGILFARAFAGSVGPLYECKEKEKHAQFERAMADCNFNGGGTDIFSALHWAHTDITTNKGDIAKAEILIITDACDRFQEGHIKKLREMFKDVTLNTLDVTAGDSTRLDGAAKQLDELSDSYMKIDPTKNNLADMVQLVGNKKKVEAK
jgi:uncharacterized protein with von Willebrand factor type A (vWA) domain